MLARSIVLGFVLCAAWPLTAIQALEPIPCETTPFGTSNLMLGDAEFISLHDRSSPSLNAFGEYRLPSGAETDALVNVYSDPLYTITLPVGAYFLDATSVDLDGDGRDEVAVVYGAPPDLGNIVIAVFQRVPGFAPAPLIIDSWRLNLNTEGTGMVTSTVELEAGDFSGTSGRRQQLALKWRSLSGPDDGRLNVIVLTGAADATIAQADNSWAGRWKSPQTLDKSSLTHGDMLLDGRDQLVVVANNGASLHTHLLEFNASGAHLNSGMPVAVGDTAIGSLAFTTSLAPFADDAYVPISTGIDCSPPFGPCEETIIPLNDFYRVVANAGDLVDTAADELLIHVAFLGQAELRNQQGNLVGFGQIGTFLGQRLLHFSTVQAAPGEDISAVSISTSGPGRDFDTSQVLGPRGTHNSLPGGEATTTAFDAALGSVFGTKQNQLALAHVVDSSADTQLQVEIYSAAVRLQSGYTFDQFEATGPFPAKFTSTATGDVASRHWDFGDGAASVAENPSHDYNATGNYTVTLLVTDSAGKQSSYSHVLQINGDAGSGGVPASYTYQMDTSPVLSARTQTLYDNSIPLETRITTNNFGNASQPRITIADMNRDGRAEILTSAQSIVKQQIFQQPFNSGDYWATIWRSRWQLDTTQIPAVLVPMHAQQVTASSSFPLPPPQDPPFNRSALVASDFDGDSVFATLGTQCGAVYEPQLRNLIWMPPFFSALQSNALDSGYMSASFGNQQTSGTSVENRSGSFSSHSVSAYVGVSAGTTDKEPVNFRATLTATAGHDWQTAKGSIHGEESEETYSEGQSATQGEALVVSEGNSALCYSYDVVQSSGPVPNSAMRMCEMASQERNAQTAEIWNGQFAYGQTVPNWTPLQRDWASRALFITPTSSIPFQSGRGLDKATDGLFSTAATSVSTTRPYLDIDLGAVTPIEAMRIFPAVNVDANGVVVKPIGFTRAALDLQDFRVYASATPFVGAQVPSGAGVREFAPPTENGMVYDRWNIMARDAAFNPMPVRYIRLQHPGADTATINISEIQVFASTHSEPPTYPQAVCQPAPGSGYFLARVWNSQAHGYQNIESRGDMMWSGTNAANTATGVKLANGDNCINHAAIRQTTIWNNLRIGNPGITHSWDSTSNTSQTVGSYGSIESATRVGAELEVELGNTYVYAVTGLSYEYTFGVTKDNQSVSYWGNGLQIGGAVGGFNNTNQNLVMPCGYFPHPYAYQLTDRGSINYQHDLYVVDYTVAQPDNGSAWQRGAVPLECYGLDDTIFADGFED